MKNASSAVVVHLLVACGALAGIFHIPNTMAIAAEAEAIAAEAGTHSSAELEDSESAPISQDVADTPSNSHEDRLREFEALMGYYYRDEPLETARQNLKEQIKQYNQWAESALAQNKAAITALNKQVESLRALDALTDEMDNRLEEKPDLSDKAAVDAYNALVEERNKRVGEYNELAKVHGKDKGACDVANERFDSQAETRKADLERLKEDFERQIEAHKRWFRTGKDLDMFKGLNRFFAQLYDERRSGDTPELVGMLDAVRSIRRELFEHTIGKHDQLETGAVVVEAKLCRQEPCFLLVDTGAMSVTIPMSLVEALGLTDHLGDEVSVAVAGGGRVRGRELTIPQVAVQGHRVEDVRAIVLSEFDAGVDGLLGLSYLKQFAFRIDSKLPAKLVIEPRSEE